MPKLAHASDNESSAAAHVASVNCNGQEASLGQAADALCIVTVCGHSVDIGIIINRSALPIGNAVGSVLAEVSSDIRTKSAVLPPGHPQRTYKLSRSKCLSPGGRIAAKLSGQKCSRTNEVNALAQFACKRYCRPGVPLWKCNDPVGEQSAHICEDEGHNIRQQRRCAMTGPVHHHNNDSSIRLHFNSSTFLPHEKICRFARTRTKPDRFELYVQHVVEILRKPAQQQVPLRARVQIHAYMQL
eukprot:COSAG02_NODE_975_length_15507_cov_14.829180_11_plen_243_part_00